MSTDLSFVEYVVDQVDNDLGISYKHMFGEFGLFIHGKIVALICDNRLFIKPTEAGRAFIGEVTEAPAYPGAKPSLLIGNELEDSAWISQLIRLTADELPAPKPRKKKASTR